jgi:UDP-N-acetylmuramoyl-tripeptide--D-alanyl-D-alanine ligase
MNFTIEQVLQFTGGELLCGSRAQRIGRICTDTRTIQPGETFLALNGPRFHGDDFVEEALYRGAAGAISSRDSIDEKFPIDRYHVRVADTERALGDIARAWRRTMAAKVIAVSGSSGKTTTKEMLSHICAASRSTLSTRGNLNNLIGLPGTLLELNESHEMAVIETGMNVPRELARLGEICDPDIAIVTNIGNAHIGNFGSLENLILCEGEIVEVLRRDGVAVLNSDCPNVRKLPSLLPMPEQVVTYGVGEEAHVRAVNIKPMQPVGYRFDLTANGESVTIVLGIYGRYQIYNVLAASAAALAAGFELPQIAAALENFQPPKLRSQAEWSDGVLIISDCYNASPDATIKSLASLTDVSGIRRRIALLGDMNELGAQSEELHRETGRAVAAARIDVLCAFGKQAGWIAEEAARGGVVTHRLEDREEAAQFVGTLLKEGDALLVKASRTVGLEKVLERVRELRRAALTNLAEDREKV